MNCLAGAYLAADEKVTIMERRLERETISRNHQAERELQAAHSDVEVAAPLPEPLPKPRKVRTKRKRAESPKDTISMSKPQSTSGAVEEKSIGAGEEAAAHDEEEEQPRKKRRTRRDRGGTR